MATLEELLRAKSSTLPDELMDIGKAVSDEQGAAPDRVQKFKDKVLKSKELQSSAADQLKSAEAKAGLPNSTTKDLLDSFSNPDQMHGEFSPMDKVPAAKAQPSLFDSVAPAAQPAEDLSKFHGAATQFENANSPLMQKLGSYPEEALAKLRMMDPKSALAGLAEKLSASKAGQMAGKAMPYAGALGEAAYAANSGKDAYNDSGSMLNSIQDPNASKLKVAADALKMAGNSAQAASVPLAMTGAGAIPAGLTAIGGMAANGVGQGLEGVDQMMNMHNDPHAQDFARTLAMALEKKKAMESGAPSGEPSQPMVMAPGQPGATGIFAQQQLQHPPAQLAAAMAMKNTPAPASVDETPPPSNPVQQMATQPTVPQAHPLDRMVAAMQSQRGDLQAAQQAANRNQLFANLAHSVNQVSGGIAGARAGLAPVVVNDQQSQAALQKGAQAPVEQYQAQIANQKNDPNSVQSKSMRDFLASKIPGMKIPEGASAADLEKIAPWAVAMQKNQNQQDYNNLLRGKKADIHANEQDTKRLDTVGKLINGGLASSRSGFGKDYGNLAAVQNVRALLNGQDLDSIDNRQIQETARVMDRILSGGSPTISGTEHLTPETARMKIAKFMEFYGNKRTGAGASDFLNNTLHTLDREEGTAKQRTLTTMKQALGPYFDIAERNPEAWDNMIAQHPELNGLMDSKSLKAVKDGGGKTATSAAQAPQKHSYQPGDTVTLKDGKSYKVGTDGDSLEAI